MATINETTVLADDFLQDLFHTALHEDEGDSKDNDYLAAMLVEHLPAKSLPDREYQNIHRALIDYYKRNKRVPPYSILKQSVANRAANVERLTEIHERPKVLEINDALTQLEAFIRQLRFQDAYKKAGEYFNKGAAVEAQKEMCDFAAWSADFSLTQTEFVDVVGSFSIRLKDNKRKHQSDSKGKPVCRFYIDGLDHQNKQRNLRGQLTCFLAPSGVGKSHIARWVGRCACKEDGLNVLHIQLEGSQAEVVDAYSASMFNDNEDKDGIFCSAYDYETGNISDEMLVEMERELSTIQGKLHVKAYPKFNANVSTFDIHNAIQDYKKRFKASPDVVIIDSMDLLTDSTGQNYSEKGERLKRIKVANDLKDLASDENVWMVTTYQSTIENQEWLNDEKNVLTAYNTSEAKGLCRPLTHLITLNQSTAESKEQTMRLHVAKSRFFKRCEPIKIATGYDHEKFYSRKRTLSMPT